MLVVHTVVLTQYVRVSSYLDGTTTSSKQKKAKAKGRRDGSSTCWVLSRDAVIYRLLDGVMRARLNLPTALVLHFELSAVVLVATSCCSMC